MEQSKRRRETTAHGMQRFCDEIEIETAQPAAADGDDISEEIVEEKQKQEKSQEE